MTSLVLPAPSADVVDAVPSRGRGAGPAQQGEAGTSYGAGPHARPNAVLASAGAATVDGASARSHDHAEGTTWLVRRREEWRQVGIVGVYWTLLGLGMFVPAAQNPLTLIAACYFSFLNAVVIHNHLHKGIFHNKRLNMIWRAILSFGALYPASTNVPAHNLVHHHFGDDGQPDWADQDIVRFRWNLLNLLHFPNINGPNTFVAAKRWGKFTRQTDWAWQQNAESVFAFGLTGALLLYDTWSALFFVFVPQFWGARGILRINLLQHDRCDITSEWNHSRNFVGRGFNWVMCNNGYHTIHHNRAGLHWADLPEAHERECKPRMHPSLDEPSMVLYLLKTYVLRFVRPPMQDLAAVERVAPSSDLASREARIAEAEVDALREAESAALREHATDGTAPPHDPVR